VEDLQEVAAGLVVAWIASFEEEQHLGVADSLESFRECYVPLVKA
jgi:hypothetical protein